MASSKAKNTLLAAIIIIAVAVVLIYLLTQHSTQPAQGNLNQEFEVVKLIVESSSGASTYYAYIATTIQQQELGYMNQSSIGNCGGKSPCLGMIFYFGNYSDECFWMKNTEIPLEQAWISENDTITYIYNATPYSTTPVCSDGLLVLEANPGAPIAVGDKLIMSNS